MISLIFTDLSVCVCVCLVRFVLSFIRYLFLIVVGVDDNDDVLICRFSVKTDLHTGKAVSRLYIANANRHDSGNYTCALGDFAKVTVSVHVLNGK